MNILCRLRIHAWTPWRMQEGVITYGIWKGSHSWEATVQTRRCHRCQRLDWRAL